MLYRLESIRKSSGENSGRVLQNLAVSLKAVFRSSSSIKSMSSLLLVSRVYPVLSSAVLHGVLDSELRTRKQQLNTR